uniref:Uncharacterized protein n=1 Tax=Anguilla anguilla TaxID=7936 RepID=A0A0E9SH38_ANGAN
MHCCLTQCGRSRSVFNWENRTTVRILRVF